MTPVDLLLDAYGRLRDDLHAAVEGLDEDQLTWRADPAANTVAWLVWHLARLQDASVAAAFRTDDLWTLDGWADRFGLPVASDDVGYGHTSEQVATVRPPAALLLAYADAVLDRTLDRLASVTPEDLDHVVDTSYDPPVTLGVRLVSVLADDLQHLGQAALLRGLLDRRG